MWSEQHLHSDAWAHLGSMFNAKETLNQETLSNWGKSFALGMNSLNANENEVIRTGGDLCWFAWVMSEQSGIPDTFHRNTLIDIAGKSIRAQHTLLHAYNFTPEVAWGFVHYESAQEDPIMGNSTAKTRREVTEKLLDLFASTRLTGSERMTMIIQYRLDDGDLRLPTIAAAVTPTPRSFDAHRVDKAGYTLSLRHGGQISRIVVHRAVKYKDLNAQLRIKRSAIRGKS